MTSARIDLRGGVVEPVVLMISRREVEAGDVTAVVDRLLALLSTPEAIWRDRGQMALLVDGYGSDPSELVDVAEVRAFLRELDRQWRYCGSRRREAREVSDARVRGKELGVR